MNEVEFFTDRDEIIRVADHEFLVVSVVPCYDTEFGGKFRVVVLDPRPEEQIRTELRNVYKRAEPIA